MKAPSLNDAAWRYALRYTPRIDVRRYTALSPVSLVAAAYKAGARAEARKHKKGRKS